jgi:sulfur carrier protein ThiS adenylyltransferase
MEITPRIFEKNVPGSTERLGSSTVAIAGCGGLGSNAAIALARAGVGRLILADRDLVEESNLNRQCYFLSDVGKVKVDALASLIRAITPGIRLDIHRIEISPANTAELFAEADLLIEAFDRAESKRWLIEAWCKSFPDRPVVGASGISGIGKSSEIIVRSSGMIHIVGDQKTSMEIGLCSARVGLVANMQANVAIALLAGMEI